MKTENVVFIAIGGLALFNYFQNNASNYFSVSGVGYTLGNNKGFVLKVDNKTAVSIPIEGIKININSKGNSIADLFLKNPNNKLNPGVNELVISLSSLNLNYSFNDYLDFILGGVHATGWIDTKFGKVSFNYKVI